MRKTKSRNKESDSVYILKMILCIFLGALWLRIDIQGSQWGIPIPIGFIVGLTLLQHEHFQIDRKIEYALLLGAMFISFFLPFGIVLSV